MKLLSPSIRVLFASVLVFAGLMFVVVPAASGNESDANDATLLHGLHDTLSFANHLEDRLDTSACIAPGSDEYVAYDEQHGDCNCTYVYRQYTEWFRCAGYLQCRSAEWDGDVVFYRMARVVKILHDCFDDQYCWTDYGSLTCTYSRCP